jgi:hypothetical protein
MISNLLQLHLTFQLVYLLELRFLLKLQIQAPELAVSNNLKAAANTGSSSVPLSLSQYNCKIAAKLSRPLTSAIIAFLTPDFL